MSEDFKELTCKEILERLDSSNEDEKKEKHIIWGFNEYDSYSTCPLSILENVHKNRSQDKLKEILSEWLKDFNKILRESKQEASILIDITVKNIGEVSYVNDNNVEIELTNIMYEELVKVIGLALSPKQVYAIHKEYSKSINEDWCGIPDDPCSESTYKNLAHLVLQNKTYQEIEDIWNERK